MASHAGGGGGGNYTGVLQAGGPGLCSRSNHTSSKHARQSMTQDAMQGSSHLPMLQTPSSAPSWASSSGLGPIPQQDCPAHSQAHLGLGNQPAPRKQVLNGLWGRCDYHVSLCLGRDLPQDAHSEGTGPWTPALRVFRTECGRAGVQGQAQSGRSKTSEKKKSEEIQQDSHTVPGHPYSASQGVDTPKNGSQRGSGDMTTPSPM